MAMLFRGGLLIKSEKHIVSVNSLMDWLDWGRATEGSTFRKGMKDLVLRFFLCFRFYLLVLEEATVSSCILQVISSTESAHLTTTVMRERYVESRAADFFLEIM